MVHDELLFGIFYRYHLQDMRTKSGNQFLQQKNRKPLCLLGFPTNSALGAQSDSNRRHSEPQSDALTN